MSDLTYGHAALLGLLQGLTEFLPISSSGHLVLGRALLRLELPGLSFEILLHAGTALAVILVYRDELGRMVRAVAGWRRHDPDFAQAWLLALATVPAALAGLTLGETALARLASPHLAASMLLVTAAVLWLGPPRPARPDPGAGRWTTLAAWRGALAIGLAQAVAILPGVSRSGATVVAGMRAGLPRQEAARFALLLSLPVIVGGVMVDAGALLGAYGDAAYRGPEAMALPLGPALVGVSVAFVAGLVAIRLLLVALRRAKLGYFALYCAVAGLGALVWL